MYRSTILLMALSVFILSETQAESANSADNDDTLKITVTSLDISDKALNLVYEIRNDSQQEVWICDDVDVYSWIHSELYLVDDDQTLMIRRRLDVPSIREWFRPPHGKYIRLRPGKKRRESLSITLPVEGNSIVFPTRTSPLFPKDLDYAARLAIEIGYYEGDLPGMILNILEEAEKIYEMYPASRLPVPVFFFQGVLDFNSSREESRQRDEEVVIPYTYQKFKGEKVLRASIDDLHIPYEGKRMLPPSPSGPDLTLCTKAEIRYQPSILEYFFPFESNQSLLSREEIEYLQSEETIVVEDQEALKAFATEIKKGIPFHGIVREVSMAHVDCYRGNDRLTSFTVYDNITVETEEKKRLKYQRGLLSIRMLTSEIRQLEYRVQCAANLRNLRYRLRLYNILEAKRRKDSSIKSETTYPTPSEWCNATSRPAYYVVGRDRRYDKGNVTMHICPSVGEGKCHYAMNPHCKPDSPPDRVLLFETKAGWNQHGGPELFTFDNHDPKGGCVLLNDGTVKFVRTKEELQQLRWK